MAPVRKGSAMSSVAVMVTTVTIYPFCYYSHSVYHFTHHLQACTSDPSNTFRRRCGWGGGGRSYLYLQQRNQGSENLLDLPRVLGGYSGQVGIERG